jgi:hypothetical protein
MNGLGARGRVLRHDTYAHDMSGGRRDSDLPTHFYRRSRIIGVETDDVGDDVQGHDGQREDPAGGVDEIPEQIEGRDRLTEELLEPGEYDVSHGVLVEWAEAGEAVLKQPCPGL